MEGTRGTKETMPPPSDPSCTPSLWVRAHRSSGGGPGTKEMISPVSLVPRDKADVYKVDVETKEMINRCLIYLHVISLGAGAP